MNKEAFNRTERVIGPKAMERLAQARVAVFGLGGVGGNCVEALTRCGVGTLDLIDNDDVAVSNLNRQVFATTKTVGMKKTEAARQRILEISPETAVNVYPIFYLPERREEIPFEEFDYIIDAIDTVTAKLDIIERAKASGIPILSSMGTGNRLDPSKLRIIDVYETAGDPLAKVMRRELRRRGVNSLDVCCSAELPVKPLPTTEDMGKRRSIPGSTSLVPPAAGILMASYVVRRLIEGIPQES